jgi:hypothetical protein
LTIFCQKGDFLSKIEQLAKHAVYSENKYLQTITNVRIEAEHVGDRKTVNLLKNIYDETSGMISTFNKQRRQQMYSQIEALEKEIEIYTEAIRKVKELEK